MNLADHLEFNTDFEGCTPEKITSYNDKAFKLKTIETDVAYLSQNPSLRSSEGKLSPNVTVSYDYNVEKFENIYI